jgi:ElaB/YqjD/DUF883 family membrane-anchored ribosome-binding protein
MVMENTSGEKIAEALQLLEEAAKQKKVELQSLLSDKYTHLKDVIVETEGSLVKALADARKHAVEAALHAKDVSVEKAREVAHDVDKHVHRNPWPCLGGTVVVTLLLGYILGRKSK